jgi:hypothetical protein
MKKFGLFIFIAALSIGIVSALNCSVGNFGGAIGFDSIKGSGNVKSEKRTVSGFNKVRAGGAVKVEIIAQKEFSVEVEADDNLLPYIKTEVDGGNLKIYSEGRIKTQNQIRVRISMPELTGLDISGASSGMVSNVKAESLDLEASGASKISIDGEVENLVVEASGASTIDAENLRTQEAVADASGASKVIVSPSAKLKAEASGASTVYYTGEPQSIDKNSSGASSVKQK